MGIEALRLIRAALPDVWFLSPGIGAQGGDLAAALDAGLTADGLGMLLPISRGISKAEPGTIRGDFCIDVGRNIIHGSDAVESAQKELALWFPEGLNEYEHAMKAWIYE